MLTLEGLIAVLSFGLTCFSIGYAIGRNDNHKSQKIAAPVWKTEQLFCLH